LLLVARHRVWPDFTSVAGLFLHKLQQKCAAWMEEREIQARPKPPSPNSTPLHQDNP
jgi:hypothetical protein